MTTEVDIANMALGAVGARSTIASFTDNTKESNVCALFFNPIVRSLLRQAEWNWARKQAALTLMADASANQSVPTPWVYKYAYPSDCAQLRYIVPTYQSIQPSAPAPGVPVILETYKGPPVRWIINQDVDSQGSPIRTILTNQPQAIAVYTAVTPVTLWDDLFIMALVGALSAKICGPVSGDKKLMAMAVEDGKSALLQAQVSDANEGIQKQDIIPDWMSIRGYQEDYIYPNLFLDDN